MPSILKRRASGICGLRRDHPNLVREQGEGLREEPDGRACVNSVSEGPRGVFLDRSAFDQAAAEFISCATSRHALISKEAQMSIRAPWGPQLRA